jgi:hypothetical protein
MPEVSSSLVQRAIAAAILALGSWWGLRVSLPAPPGLAAPTAEFSADRAMKHVRAIASKPHPAGSPEAAAARDYILTELSMLGIPAEIQRGVGLYQRNAFVLAGKAENVAARIKGTGGGRAILLSGHYDSVRSGPGAADDGHAVGVLLETARILKAGAPLRNDVIFLFDVEETGMTGADAFARAHPWRKDVDVVLNFESRGTRGPVFMFQTSDGNGALIREFAAAAPYPVATSLAYEIYKRIPNDTDFSVFKKYGYAGLDFAFIDNVLAYHTPFDDVPHLDPATVQHAGSYALSLARRFGNADLAEARKRTGDAVYFQAGGFFFHYPASLASALTLASLGLLWFALGWLHKIGAAAASRVTVKGTALGALISLVAAAIAGYGMGWVWEAIRLFHPGYFALPQDDLYARNWYIVVYFALAAALWLGGLMLSRRYGSVESFAAGGLVLNALLLIAATALLPGGSYILLWPVVGGTLALLAGPRRPALGAVCCLPALWLLLQFACFGFTGLMMKSAGISSALLILALSACAMPVAAIVADYPVRWIAALGAVVLLALAGGAWANQFDTAHPIENDVSYVADAGTGLTWWVSRTDGSDPWLRQFLGNSPERLHRWYDLAGTVQRAPAPKIDVAAPVVTVTGEVTGRGKRSVDLKIVSRRSAVVFYVQVLNPADLIRGSVEGIPWEKNGAPSARAGWQGLPTVEYTAAGSEGAALGFEVKAGAKLKVRVLEPVQGLPRGPEFHWLWRGPGLLAAPAHPFNDDTVVVQSFEF